MIFEMPSCGGCRTCEMACSFKKVGQFQPQKSTIRILEKENFSGFLVSFIEGEANATVSCEDCKADEIPLCMVYCRKRDDLRVLLQKYLEKNQL
jgi:Fe-S-cluster-containing hydrogenase component 2